MFKTNNRRCCSGVFMVDCDMLFYRILFADLEHVNGRWNALLPSSKSMHFRVRSKSPVTFKSELYVTTITTVSSHYLISVTERSILDVA